MVRAPLLSCPARAQRTSAPSCAHPSCDVGRCALHRPRVKRQRLAVRRHPRLAGGEPGVIAVLRGTSRSVTTFGYFLSSEEHPPAALVDQAVRAEQHGFDALWISDHYHPWNDEQGQSAFVWSVL